MVENDLMTLMLVASVAYILVLAWMSVPNRKGENSGKR